MTSMLGQQGADSGGLDLLAINRDADLLDLLARRAPVPAGDPVLALLAALAADVDQGLDELLVASEDDPLVRAASAATVVPDLRTPRRGLGLRATTVAIVVGATLSIGGVAAAVTGDPLAPVKGIATAVGIGADKHEGKANARDAAQQARSALAHGDVTLAQASLAAMKDQLKRGDLSKGDRRSIEARIAALQKQVDHAVAEAADPQGGAEANGDDTSKADDGSVTSGKTSGHTGAKATGGKPATQTTEPGAGTQSGTGGEDKKPDATSDGSSDPTDRVRPSSAAGADDQKQSSSSDGQEDDPVSTTADADPGAPSGGATAGDEGAAGTRGAAKGTSTAR